MHYHTINRLLEMERTAQTVLQDLEDRVPAELVQLLEKIRNVRADLSAIRQDIRAARTR